MPYEDAYLIAFGITLVGTLAVTAYLHGPMRRLLPHLCRSPERAHFWSACLDILLVLTPLAALLLSLAFIDHRLRFSPMDLVNLLWAPVLGLVAAVLLIALFVAAISNQEPPWGTTDVSGQQREDMRRLLGKVESLRAREVLERQDRPR